MTESAPKNRHRPPFLDHLGDTYNLRRKNIAVLTGDIHGLFESPSRQEFSSLEQVLQAEQGAKFYLLQMDIAGGLAFYDKATEDEVIHICESADGGPVAPAREKLFRELLNSSKHNPLPSLILLRGMAEDMAAARQRGQHVKPLCVVFRFAGALFPAGDYARLSELDRQRLVAFLSWVSGPAFRNGPDLLLLLNDVKSELNEGILALPNATHLEIDLPDEQARLRFIEHFASKSDLRLQSGREIYAKDTAGLSLNQLNDVMEEADRRRQALSREVVVHQVNEILQARLGKIIRIKYPSHGVADIIGHQRTHAIFSQIFERCEDPETAVVALLVSGPNGGGKTFQLEAQAAASGRVVIELVGIRGQTFGETDKFFELLRWQITTFGKILILVREAHTALSSVHSSLAHETEQRLSGNIIKMMGDPSYLGKVVWALMTSRPDKLDPDIKSRAPIQVPIFDFEGDDRARFVREVFQRKKITLSEADLTPILEQTDYYSARDFRNFVAEVLAQRKRKPDVSPLAVLNDWSASQSIRTQREFQEVIAAQHCSYPDLLPERYRKQSDLELKRHTETLRALLGDH